MPNDPGPTVRLQVTPVGAAQAAPQSAIQADSGVTYIADGVPVSPEAVPTATVGYPVYTRPYYYPAYPSYYPYYAPVGVSIGFGYYGGGHHGHWR